MVFHIQRGFTALDGDDDELEFVERVDLTGEYFVIHRTRVPERNASEVILGRVVYDD